MGFFAVLLFLPETKGLSLEELDQVFGESYLQTFNFKIRARWLSFRDADHITQASPPTSMPPTACVKFHISSVAISSASTSSRSGFTSTNPGMARRKSDMMPILSGGEHGHRLHGANQV